MRPEENKVQYQRQEMTRCNNDTCNPWPSLQYMFYFMGLGMHVIWCMLYIISRFAA